MSALISGILSQHPIAHGLPKAHAVSPQAAAPTSSSGSDSATISANDFLTLLVTEMKNQDPTANTDPNEYVNQLVQVNSLQQLISINQTLTSDSPNAGITRDPTIAQFAPVPGTAQSGATAPLPVSAGQHGIAGSAVPHTVEGNLAVPSVNPAAVRVAQSLTLPSHGR